MQLTKAVASFSPRKRGEGALAPARKKLKVPYLFIFLCMSPWIFGIIIFTAYPMVASFYQSFTKFNLIDSPEWVGLENFHRMFFEDSDFWLALRNTVWISAISIPLRIAFAMFTAWVLTKPKRGSSIYRTIFFLPSMVPTVAASMVFTYIFNPAYGPINRGLEAIGIKDPPFWFMDPKWSKWGLILLGLWGIGDTMIIYLAGLLDVPKSLYEAASLEGATQWQSFRYVTLPMMTPVIFFSFVTGVIGSFQYFTQAYVASGQVNDYSHAMYFYATHIYFTAFRAYEMGYASALAWVLLVITLVCTLIILKTQKRWVHYPNGSLFK
ncbi:MAG: sugar ABC transporter permease [Actinobacteria bacterium]|nr:sugar ABC transporter permease [Actinomycetota bacterium]